MKQLTLLKLPAIITLLAALLCGCEKKAPKISTIAVTEITTGSASSGGNVIDEGDGSVTSRGIVWGEEDPTIELNDGLDLAGTGGGVFECSMTDLNPYTSYIVKAFATNKYGTTYGNELEFRTLAEYAALITIPAASVTDSSAVLGGSISDEGGASVTERGFYYGVTDVPELNGIKIQAGSGSGAFTAAIKNLSAGTMYFARAYAVNLRGEITGNRIFFSVSTSVPRVITAEPSEVTSSSAKSGGQIKSAGGYTILEKGIFYSVSSNPQVSGIKINAGTGPDVFTSILSALEPGTKYYIAAFARNSLGTGYGTVKSFTTGTTKPLVSTISATGVSFSQATMNGNLTSSGGLSITEKGFYWGTSSTPETSGTRQLALSGAGTFSYTLADLAESTDYYYKAFAVNSLGESTGTLISFRTGSKIKPGVLTSAAISVTSSSAVTGGNVYSEGTSPVLESGVYWGTSGNPETNGTKQPSGSTGPGTFSIPISGLTENTTYYTRAYAVSAAGESIGNVVTFTTGLGTLTGAKVFNSSLTYGTVADVEGNSYKTIVIGTQTWFAENLKTATYNDGVPVTNITGNSAWLASITPAYSWYENNPDNKELAGGKYNFWVAASGKICPTGWHVPTDSEWTTLTNYLGGVDIAGGKLKEAGLTHWKAPNSGADNSSGFTSLPTGIRHESDGGFRGLGEYDCWWSSTEYNEYKAFYRSNNTINTIIWRSSGSYKYNGMGIRCLKD